MISLLMSAALAGPPTSDAPFDARPRRHWDLTQVTLDLQVNPAARTVAGTVVHEVSPLGLPSSTVRLNQVGLQISEVTVDGEPVTPRLGPETLDVPVEAGKPHTIAITWSATPQTGAHFRDATSARGVEVWTQGENSDHRHWFPGWDHPSDTFPVDITLTVPTGLHAIANGRMIDRAPAKPGWSTWRYELDEPIVNYLVAFAVGDYAVYTDDSGPVPHEYVAAKRLPERAVRTGLDRSPAIVAYLADLLGHPFPYPVYRQVAVQRFMYGGMENASLTVLADRLLEHPADLPGGRVTAVVAHEAAHQWFGDLLTTHGWRELWLNEGFATFYAARWAEHDLGPGAYAGQVTRWAEPARTTKAPMSKRGWAGAPDHGPNTAVYVRGASVLHMLRVWLGDALYDQAIRTYVARHAFSLVETSDLRQAFEDTTGLDLRWFFDRWVHGWGAPALASGWKHADGRLEVTVTQSGDDAYEGPLEVRWSGGGTSHVEQVWLSRETMTLRVDAEAVDWVSVDPRGGVLADWTHKQPTAAWSAQIREAPEAFARMAAVRQLGSADDGDAAVPVLREVLLGDHRVDPPTGLGATDPRNLSRHAAIALGKLGSETARDALIEALRHDDTPPRLRAEALDQLGGFSLDPVAIAALRSHLVDDLPGVAAAALRNLAEASPSLARAAAITALGRRDNSGNRDLRVAALDVLGDHGKPTDRGRAIKFVTHGLRSVQHSAGGALVDLAKHEDAFEDDAVDTARRLAEWLHHDDQRTRRAAIWLLASLGEPSAVSPLQAYVARTRIERHRDAALAAITTIRSGDGQAEDPDAILEAQATIDALGERIEDLEARIHDLEAW